MLHLQTVILTSLTFSLAWSRHHHGSHPFHLKHFRVSSPGECQEGAHHFHHVHVGSGGGCETLSLRGDRCIEILQNDCIYEFYSGDQCRGDMVQPNQGLGVGSVRIKKCPDGDGYGFRLNHWVKKGKGKNRHPKLNSIHDEGPHHPQRPHHHDKSTVEYKDKPWYWDR